jgi:hypothetical protein
MDNAFNKKMARRPSLSGITNKARPRMFLMEV